MILAETWWPIAVEHIVSFGVGIGVGFVASNRWKIIRRNGDAPRPR